MTVAEGRGVRADPNVTPLIDVLLVLLIIFMVIVPVTPKGLAVLVPQPPQHAAATDNPIVLEVLRMPSGAAYRINGTTMGGGVAGQARLAAELNRIYSTRADKVLFVEGDPGAQLCVRGRGARPQPCRRRRPRRHRYSCDGRQASRLPLTSSLLTGSWLPALELPASSPLPVLS